MAPTPKPPGGPRRRNLGQSPWRLLPAEGRGGPAPALPDGDWLPSTAAWWATVWGSPMSVAYVVADESALVRLARLRERSEREDAPSAAVLREMRALEDRFGLNPKARRSLQWEISKGVDQQN